MSPLQALTVAAIFLVSALVGGASLRLLVVVARPEAAATAGLLALALAGVAAVGMRAGGRAETPYW